MLIKAYAIGPTEIISTANTAEATVAKILIAQYYNTN